MSRIVAKDLKPNRTTKETSKNRVQELEVYAYSV